MNPWIYNADLKEYDFLHYNESERPIGFIYKITNQVNGKIYIGRKSFISTSKVSIGKRATAKLIDRRASKKKTVVKEMKWRTYTGSNKQLNEDIKSGDTIIREIIHLCFTKKQMTYWELYYQMKENVLERDSYNDNILGKFFRSDLLNKAA